MTLFDFFAIVAVALCIGLIVDDQYGSSHDNDDMFMVVDGCYDAVMSCNHSIYMLQKTIFDQRIKLNMQSDALWAKDKEMKSEAFIQTSKERKILEGRFILIVAVFFGSYILLNKYLNFKKESNENTKKTDKNGDDKDVE